MNPMDISFCSKMWGSQTTTVSKTIESNDSHSWSHSDLPFTGRVWPNWICLKIGHAPDLTVYHGLSYFIMVSHGLPWLYHGYIMDISWLYHG